MTQEISIALSSEIIYVTGFVNAVAATFTLHQGVWKAVVDRSSDGLYKIQLTAYDALGNSTTHETVLRYGLFLVTDRTFTDVNYAAANKDSNVPLKGAYNADDYNRVGVAVNYLSDYLFIFGYGLNPKLRTNWQITENFTPEDGQNYLNTIRELRNSFSTFLHTLPLPDHIHDLFKTNGYVWANNIELLFIDIQILIENMLAAFIVYSGEPYSGEV